MQVELFVRMIEENPAIKTAARVFAARPSKDSTKETSVVALSARPGVTHATAVRGLEPGLLTSYALWEKVAQYIFIVAATVCYKDVILQGMCLV